MNSNHWYFDIVDENGNHTEYETNDVFSIKELIFNGKNITNIEDEHGFANIVHEDGQFLTLQDAELLERIDMADVYTIGKYYANLVLGYNHRSVDETNVYVGDINTYAQECIANRLNMDFDDVFILLYVNIERFARDMLVNDCLVEFSVGGQEYVYIP